MPDDWTHTIEPGKPWVDEFGFRHPGFAQITFKPPRGMRICIPIASPLVEVAQEFLPEARRLAEEHHERQRRA